MEITLFGLKFRSVYTLVTRTQYLSILMALMRHSLNVALTPKHTNALDLNDCRAAIWTWSWVLISVACNIDSNDCLSRKTLFWLSATIRSVEASIHWHNTRRHQTVLWLFLSALAFLKLFPRSTFSSHFSTLFWFLFFCLFILKMLCKKEINSI